MQKLAGIVVSSAKVDFVVLGLDSGQFEFVSQGTIKAPIGERPEAYRVVYEQVHDRFQADKIDCVCIKGSAVSLGGTKLAHLESAELRGVVMAAAATAVNEVRCVTKATTSRTFGTRKVDEYVKDDTFWNGFNFPDLKRGLREAALTVISQFS